MINRFTATAMIFTILCPSTVYAQPAPDVFTLTVTGQEVNIIGQGLGEMPFKHAQPLLQKLNDQVQKQIEERAKKVSPDTKPADTKDEPTKSEKP